MQTLWSSMACARHTVRGGFSLNLLWSSMILCNEMCKVWCCCVMGTLCLHKSIFNIIWHHISAEIRVTSTAFADWRLEPLWGMTPVLLRQPNLRSSVARHRSLVRCITKPGHGYHKFGASLQTFRTWKEQAEPAEPAHREAKPRCGSAWGNPWQISNSVRRSPSPSQEMANGSTMTLKHRRGAPVIKYHVVVYVLCSCYPRSKIADSIWQRNSIDLDWECFIRFDGSLISV